MRGLDSPLYLNLFQEKEEAMCKEGRTLTWGGMPHTLECSFISGETIAILAVRKEGKPQVLPARCEMDILSETIEAWNNDKHNQNWIDVIVVNKVADGKAFFAIRVIEVEGKGCWMWVVNHLRNHPKDSFTFVDGVTAEDIRNGVVAKS